MRSVSYKLSDGTVTKSYAVAKESGLPFETHLETVVEDRKPMMESRKQKLAEYFQKKRK